MNAQSPRRMLLDDTDYRIVLDDRQATDIASGVLERKCLASSSTPGGTAGVGAFEIQRDGTGTAWIAVPSGKDAGADLLVMAPGVERVAAIDALWHARADAFLNQCSL